MPETIKVNNARKTVLSVSEISHFYSDLKVIDNFGFELSEGESVGIVAPSGAGKSTLLRIILGIEKPTTGLSSIHLAPAEMGVAFQEDSLLPWLNVLENISLLHGLHRKSPDPILFDHAIKAAGLDRFKNYFPSQMSTGMKQKAALLRLLTYKPKLYALDEAMANLDDFSKFSVCDELYSRCVNNGDSVIFITHNLTDALHMADRILIGSKRPFRVTHEFQNPLSRSRNYRIRFTQEFQRALDQLHSCIEQL